ncbi:MULTISPECIES: hypothetical protein [unclassified Bradyrhizobium]|uniref:hypothetical protein n=1 Tax=unclassified Bradyrhizobium TaxID=2631580 RepID=UPI001FF97591|nr:MULTISPECIES: hypothetical protein [unclassified Bradyrhizobium]MCK1669250.1 hypothetical protein [Bradyrhizobium sp. 153]MCK1755854.1 hypothetical protein [Bradyrhizobium sp. 137]
MTTKLPWHVPKIIDRGIRVPPKKNTWPTFFEIVGKHFASHQTFPVVYPEVKITPTCVVRRRLLTRKRVGELRARRRTRADRHDPVEFRHIPLPRSVIDQIAADLRIKRADDEPVTDKQWDKLINDVIATIVVKVVTRK